MHGAVQNRFQSCKIQKVSHFHGLLSVNFCFRIILKKFFSNTFHFFFQWNVLIAYSQLYFSQVFWAYFQWNFFTGYFKGLFTGFKSEISSYFVHMFFSHVFSQVLKFTGFFTGSRFCDFSTKFSPCKIHRFFHRVFHLTRHMPLQSYRWTLYRGFDMS